MCTSERFRRQVLLSLLVIFSLALVEVRSQELLSSIEQLAKESDAVVVGRVAGLSSEWNNNRTRIQTRVTITVDQCLKGDAGKKSMTVMVPGGEVDGIGEVYSHAPRFLRDEAVVLFAKKNASGDYHVSEGTQGKYTLRRDRVSGRLLVAGERTLEEFTASVRTALQIQNIK